MSSAKSSVPVDVQVPWRKCPACGGREFRVPTAEELSGEPRPSLVCAACGLTLSVTAEGVLEPAR